MNLKTIPFFLQYAFILILFCSINVILCENSAVEIAGDFIFTGALFSLGGYIGKKIFDYGKDYINFKNNKGKFFDIYFYKNIVQNNEKRNYFFHELENNLFSQLKDKKDNSFKNNKILILSENIHAAVDELLCAKLMASYLEMNCIVIEIKKVNTINEEDFITTLKELLKKENNIFFLDVDIFLTKEINNIFSHDLFQKIVGLFQEYTSSILCAKINHAIFITDAVLSLFDYKINLYKVNKTEAAELIGEALRKNNIFLSGIEASEMVNSLNEYSFNELNAYLKLIIAISKNNNNILDKNTFFAVLTKFNNTLKQEKEAISANKINDNADDNKKNFTFEYVNNFSLKDIAGYDEVKKKMFYFLKTLKIKKSKRFPGIIFYGPSGTGKTLFVKAIAGETKLPIISINAAKLLHKYQGETEKNIAQLFKVAKENAPCIIFIDEIDTLLHKRVEGREANFVNEILPYLDGGMEELLNVCVIGATNKLSQIDESVLRPGRIDKKIFIDFPNSKDRKDIIYFYLDKYNFYFHDNISVDTLSEQLDGFSGADIKGLFIIINELLDQEKNEDVDYVSMIDDELLDKAYKIFKEENRKDDFKFKIITNFTLKNLAGYSDLKEEMEDILVELKKQYIKKSKLEGVILYGPPGTGKTNFAKILACESQLPMLAISSLDIMGKYVGESEEKLTLLFENIRKNSPCIVFIDEMEELFSNRSNIIDSSYGGSLNKKIVNMFLQNIDGLDALKGVLFIGATNFIDKLDPALTRSGRMSRRIKVAYPQYKDRISIIAYYVKKENFIFDKSITIEYLAERTNGMSPADIQKYIEIMKQLNKKLNKNSIDMEIVTEAYQQMTLGKKNKGIILKNDDIEQIAYHEACHAIFQYILFKTNQSLYKFDFLTIEPRAKALGVAYGKLPAEYVNPTKERYLGNIAINLAGKAGQEIFFNTIDSGASNDLENATAIAREMITKIGMGEGLRVFKESTEGNKAINYEVDELLKRIYKKVLTFLEEHKQLIINIVKKVFEKKILYEAEMKMLIDDYELKSGKKLVYKV